MSPWERKVAEFRAEVEEILARGDPYEIRTLEYILILCRKFHALKQRGYRVRMVGSGLQARLVIAGGSLRHATH